MNTSLQSLGTLQARQQQPSRRLIGQFDSLWVTERGDWIRHARAPFYFRWSDNPGLRRMMPDHTPLQFTLIVDERGRPIAINVTEMKQSQRLSGAPATGSGAPAAGEMQPSR